MLTGHKSTQTHTCILSSVSWDNLRQESPQSRRAQEWEILVSFFPATCKSLIGGWVWRFCGLWSCLDIFVCLFSLLHSPKVVTLGIIPGLLLDLLTTTTATVLSLSWAGWSNYETVEGCEEVGDVGHYNMETWLSGIQEAQTSAKPFGSLSFISEDVPNGKRSRWR